MKKFGISSSTLHILAMIFMLCDHIWATIYSLDVLTCIGRIAFPIFAFMIVEGYFHTKNIKKYIKRIFIFAIISEVPMNLMVGASIIYPLHQNVLWTLLISLIGIDIIEKIKKKNKLWLTVLISILCVGVSFVLGFLTFIDYYGFGILTVYVFYFFKKKNLISFIGQFIGLTIINVELIGGLCYEILIFGRVIYFPQQAFALLSLIFIWLYNGKKGINSKYFKYFCYIFYPLHLLILGCVGIFI